MAEELTIDVSGVSQWFGDVQALTNLTIQVPTGSITVLLGPNGAGKTTAIRLVTGALSPGQGSTRVFGLDPDSAEGEEVRRRCGVVSAKPSLYDRLNGWDNLRYAAALYGLGHKADARIKEASAHFGIDAALDQQVGGYSTGMKTRLALARSILHQPDLLLLDEPTSGLDPESAVAVLELIRQMTGDGRTVLLCTHLLLEAEGLADQIVVMQHGTNLLSGTASELTKEYFPRQQLRLSAVRPEDLDILAGQAGVLSYERSNDTAMVEIESLDQVPALVSSLVRREIDITSVVPVIPTLEDLYFAVRRGQIIAADEMPPPPQATGRPVRRPSVAHVAK